MCGERVADIRAKFACHITASLFDLQKFRQSITFHIYTNAHIHWWCDYAKKKIELFSFSLSSASPSMPPPRTGAWFFFRESFSMACVFSTHFQVLLESRIEKCLCTIFFFAYRRCRCEFFPCKKHFRIQSGLVFFSSPSLSHHLFTLCETRTFTTNWNEWMSSCRQSESERGWEGTCVWMLCMRAINLVLPCLWQWI